MPGWPAVLSAEDFHVRTVYEFHGPVTYVSYAGLDRDEWAGSQAVVLVREFLIGELRAKASANLGFVLVGPSPFHADFMVTTSQDSSSHPPSRPAFRFDKVIGPGYGEVTIEVDSNRFAGRAEALEAVWNDLSSELDTFYEIVRDRNARLEAATKALALADRLAETHQKKGMFASVRRLFGTGADARAISLAVIHVEVGSARARRSLKEEVEGLIDLAGEPRFLKEMMRFIDEDFSPETKAARSVAESLEGARRKELEIVILSASTLLGALAGAAASILVR